MSDRLDRHKIEEHIGIENTAISFYLEDEVTSTNDRVFALCQQEEQANFVALCAEFQQQGRGRRGRTWFSRKGEGLMLSVGLTFSDEQAAFMQDWPFLTALAVRRALLWYLDLDVAIKWPNDLLVDGKKIAGILIERRAKYPNRLILGIGMNVLTRKEEFEPDLQSRVTSLIELVKRPIDRSALAGEVIAAIYRTYVDVLQGQRFHDLYDEFIASCETIGKRVTVHVGEHRHEGVVTKIDREGTLFLQKENGESVTLISGEIVMQIDQ